MQKLVYVKYQALENQWEFCLFLSLYADIFDLVIWPWISHCTPLLSLLAKHKCQYRCIWWLWKQISRDPEKRMKIRWLWLNPFKGTAHFWRSRLLVCDLLRCGEWSAAFCALRLPCPGDGIKPVKTTDEHRFCDLASGIFSASMLIFLPAIKYSKYKCLNNFMTGA